MWFLPLSCLWVLLVSIFYNWFRSLWRLTINHVNINFLRYLCFRRLLFWCLNFYHFYLCRRWYRLYYLFLRWIHNLHFINFWCLNDLFLTLYWIWIFLDWCLNIRISFLCRRCNLICISTSFLLTWNCTCCSRECSTLLVNILICS